MSEDLAPRSGVRPILSLVSAGLRFAATTGYCLIALRAMARCIVAGPDTVTATDLTFRSGETLMSRRNAFLITASAVGIGVALFLPSLTVRAVVAALVLAVALSLLVRSSQNAKTLKEDVDQTNDRSAESFAFGKLFEATMVGMREGLLVVNKDMRVVASNTAAHRLFNPTRGPLNGQRLTELTRNAAIYDAFLDALKGTERSGVKIQTYGAERRIFDLRVVPLGAPTARQTLSRRKEHWAFSSMSPASSVWNRCARSFFPTFLTSCVHR